MKKYLSILLAAAVVTGLAGCGGSNTGTTQAPATQASESKAPDAPVSYTHLDVYKRQPSH